MKYPIYSIRDLKVGFGFPQCDQSDQTAIRGFSFAVNTGDGMMGYQPKDYDLYKIGEFDTEKGTIEGIIPELVANGDAMVNAK